MPMDERIRRGVERRKEEKFSKLWKKHEKIS